MSHPSWNAAPQPPSSPPHSPSQSELAKRIERFQKAAQDLLALYEPGAPSPDGVPHPATGTDGETRCYYLSPGAVRHERELLQRYRVEDFGELLAEAHMLLVGLVKIMKTTRPMRCESKVMSSPVWAVRWNRRPLYCCECGTCTARWRRSAPSFSSGSRSDRTGGRFLKAFLRAKFSLPPR